MSGASITSGTGFGGVTRRVQNLFDKFISIITATRFVRTTMPIFLGSRAQFTLDWDYWF
jgi:hypothetical protein